MEVKKFDADECYALVSGLAQFCFIDSEAEERAKVFITYLSLLPNIRHPLYVSRSEGDRSVEFFWIGSDNAEDNENYFLDLGFDNECGSYYARLPDGTEHRSDDFNGKDLPQPIIDFLTLDKK